MAQTHQPTATKDEVAALFVEAFPDISGDSSAKTFSSAAPGRVNLIGEHTDYSGGFVLPLALPLQTYVTLTLAPTGMLRAISREQGRADISLAGSIENDEVNGVWTDYLVGAVKEMQALGASIPGLSLAVGSDVPLGAGVSSSAAFEIAVLRALRDAADLDVSDKELAYAAQRIENNHLGLKTGIMDQMASSLGTAGAPLLFDTFAGQTRPLSMFQDATFLTFHSGVSRCLVEGAYNERRAATDAALAQLGVDRLVDVSDADLETLAAPIKKRARHVVNENKRVQQAVEALEADDPKAFGILMNAAHVSMRDDFEASHEDVDAQVAFALDQGALGARITGAGFGGCYVVLVDNNDVAPLEAAILAKFPEAKRVA